MYVWCCKPGVGACVVLYIVYVYVLYNMIGQTCMGLSSSLLLILRVEEV